LAVEDGPDRAILVGQGLVAAGQVDDREPPKTQRGVCVAAGPRIIGAAMLDARHHRREGALGPRVARAGPDRPAHPAHAQPLSSDTSCRLLLRTSSLIRASTTSQFADRYTAFLRQRIDVPAVVTRVRRECECSVFLPPRLPVIDGIVLGTHRNVTPQ